MTQRSALFSVLGITLVLLFLWQSIRPSSEENPTDQPATRVQTEKVEMVDWEDDDGNPIMIPESELPEVIKKEREERRKRLEQTDNWWRTPITFYGKVVDEAGHLVPKAEIKVGVNDDSSQGSTEFTMQADEYGSFTVTNIKGKHLHVEVAKKGFQAGRDSFRSFEYAGTGNPFQPNPEKPEIFRLHKKAEPVPLVSNQKLIELKLGDTAQWLDFYTLSSGSAQTSDAIQLSAQNEKINGIRRVIYRLSVIGGGILPTSEEFPTHAPAGEYVETIEIVPDRIGDYHYYLAFPSGNFGRVKLNLIPGSPSVKIAEAILNPDGGRILAFDPKLRIQVKLNQDRSISLIYPKGYEPKHP